MRLSSVLVFLCFGFLLVVSEDSELLEEIRKLKEQVKKRDEKLEEQEDYIKVRLHNDEVR